LEACRKSIGSKVYIFFLLKNQRDELAKMDIGIERQGVAVSPR
jgi:hypothetical protein